MLFKEYPNRLEKGSISAFINEKENLSKNSISK